MKIESNLGTKSSGRSRSPSSRGFTLIELLVVIAIIALLIGILLPSLGRARESARDMKCKSNMKQVATSLMLYSNDFKGVFPPILDLAPDAATGKLSMIWYDEVRIGAYWPNLDNSNLSFSNAKNNTVGGGAMLCPSHPAAGRSYTMNFWAASAGSWRNVNGRIESFRPGSNPMNTTERLRGRGWDTTVEQADRMMLVGEAWGFWQAENGADRWFTNGQVGLTAAPGRRFGAGRGVTETGEFPGQWSAKSAQEFGGARLSDMKSYIPWYRHPRKAQRPWEISGNANFAFADGHVGGASSQEVADITTGLSTFKVMWSPMDREIDR
jgi:prepilin-type N-terminal cleavage/methylation domain-containing protein/prepilin-type processing-associated H-X9-DG protein